MPAFRLVSVAILLGAALAIPSIGRALPAIDDLIASAREAAAALPRALPTELPTELPTGLPTELPAIPGEAPTGGPSTSAPGPTPSARAGNALAAVSTLAVKGRAPRTGYDRDLFGSAWLDTDRNGCDTRNDVLRRDLTAVEIKAGTRGCVVLRGILEDPYTGRAIAFVRGQDTSSQVQVDHVVALSDAWQKGAQGLPDHTREAFANDPLNLLAVDGPTNQSKGDGDTATWLPPDRAIRCAYVARQVAVKAKYRLWVTEAERDAMVKVLTTCPREPLPVAVPFVLAKAA